MIDDVFIANHFSTSPSEGVGEKSASFVVTETWLENSLEISIKLKSGKRCGMDNLQLVCRNCHAEIHGKHGERRYIVNKDGSVNIK